MITAKRLTPADVRISISIEENDQSPRDSMTFPGIPIDRDEIDRFVRAVEEMVDRHGLWGWCQVEVTAALGDLQGTAYLGDCSYADEADFRRGGYFEQTVAEAIADLQAQVDNLLPLIVDVSS